jgi:hypothetical protein
LDQYEFEQVIEASSFTQGKLHANFTFWRDTIQASDFVLDIIQNGYKILFMESPLPFSIENRSSALRRDTKPFVVTPPRLVNSQLVSLQPVGILNKFSVLFTILFFSIYGVPN